MFAGHKSLARLLYYQTYFFRLFLYRYTSLNDVGTFWEMRR